MTIRDITAQHFDKQGDLNIEPTSVCILSGSLDGEDGIEKHLIFTLVQGDFEPGEAMGGSQALLGLPLTNWDDIDSLQSIIEQAAVNLWGARPARVSH